MKRLQFRAHRTLPRPIASINVVGLLAVLGPLLVIYLVVVGQHHDAGPRLPSARYASIQPDPFSTETFRFYGADAVFVDGQVIDPTEMDEYVRRACAPMMSFIGSGDDAIYIEADPELPYGAVLDVLERCRRHGGRHAVFVTRRNITVAEAWTLGDLPPSNLERPSLIEIWR